MKNGIMILMIVATGFSCPGQSSTDSVYAGAVDSGKTEVVIKPETKDVPDSRWIDTKDEYTDPEGKRLVTQNGLPRGGTKYTGPNGEVYGYAVFWTRIINETDHPLELKIDFLSSYEVPSSPGKYFKLLVLPDTMTRDKEDLFNYGLANLESFLDNRIHKPSSLKRTINPKESSGFYVVKLSLASEGPRGGGDILRTGLGLKGQDLFYRVSVYNGTAPPFVISEKKIHCGSINLKSLVLRK